MAPKISKAKVDYLRGLWNDVMKDVYNSRIRREAALRAFIRRIAGVSGPELLNYKKASRVIAVLRERQGKKAKDSLEAQKMLKRSLSAAQRRTLQKIYPFHEERDELIRFLRSQGITYILLARVSGLGKTWVWQIVTEGAKKGMFSSRNSNLHRKEEGP
jgi:hypothetical protein